MLYDYARGHDQTQNVLQTRGWRPHIANAQTESNTGTRIKILHEYQAEKTLSSWS